MELSPDTAPVTNPARAAARAQHKAAEDAVATLERAIGTTGTSPGEIAETNREFSRLPNELATARIERDEAKQTLKPIPAKVAKNELDPSAMRAVSRLSHRALQMVCRLLAFRPRARSSSALSAVLRSAPRPRKRSEPPRRVAPGGR